MLSNYIIPSEYEMLEMLSRNTGVAVTWDCNAKSFLQSGKLQLLWESDRMPDTEVYLLSGKHSGFNTAAQEIEEELKKVLA